MGGFNFSKWLAQKLDEKDITHRELAEMVGITEVSMSRYYNGKRIPTVDVAMDIAIALGQDGLRIEEAETEKNEEIECCPFCGKTAVLRQRFRTSKEIEDDVPELFWVECFDSECCGAETGCFHSKEEALNAWNRRN